MYWQMYFPGQADSANRVESAPRCSDTSVDTLAQVSHRHVCDRAQLHVGVPSFEIRELGGGRSVPRLDRSGVLCVSPNSFLAQVLQKSNITNAGSC